MALLTTWSAKLARKMLRAEAVRLSCSRRPVHPLGPLVPWNHCSWQEWLPALPKRVRPLALNTTLSQFLEIS